MSDKSEPELRARRFDRIVASFFEGADDHVNEHHAKYAHVYEGRSGVTVTDTDDLDRASVEDIYVAAGFRWVETVDLDENKSVASSRKETSS